MIYAAVLAGGTGTRMGADKPKQFLEFGGKPVIVHTVERFLECDEIDRVIVMTPAEWCDYTRNLLMQYFGGPASVAGGEKPGGAGKDSGESTRITVAAGGPTRNETLMNAISVIEVDGSLDDETAIVTHDAVRPFVLGLPLITMIFTVISFQK